MFRLCDTSRMLPSVARYRRGIALVRAAEIIILFVFAVAGVVDRGPEILRPQAAGAGNRRNLWIAQPDRRQRSDVVRMVVMQRDRMWGDAACRKYRPNFAECGRRSPGVRRVDRHVGHDRTGAFADPCARQSHDVAALRNRQAAARLADKDHERAVRFRDRDRMPLAVIVGNARGHDFTGRIVARPQHD